ncbi:hypothetical protein R6Q57_018650 [Mikania cordata]
MATKKPKRVRQQLSTNSDDDFVCPPPAGASTSASHQFTYKPISKGRIRVRNNPSHLFDLVQSLTEQQKNVVKSIGFSGALQFKLDGVPTCLGLWLITNYDHTTNTLHLGSHTISITRDLVRDVLGIPMGGRQINEILKPSFTDPVVAEFRNQFGKNSDCRTDVLNSEDQYRNKSDPKRLFTPCLMLVDSHYKDDVEEVDRITSFTENMEICLKSAELDSLIGVDMLLIPMLHACHYYVLCFNLNKTQFFVIDNIGIDVDFDIKYAKRPQIMQSTLCSYLVMTSHPIAFTLKTCKPKRLPMPWRTLNNSVDCGVFAMCHMETFKGTSVKEWKCGLTSESDEQQKQLNDLRIKYLAKILLSDINIHKGEVVSEVRAYMNLPNDVKKKMREGVFERIKQRVRSAF